MASSSLDKSGGLDHLMIAEELGSWTLIAQLAVTAQLISGNYSSSS